MQHVLVHIDQGLGPIGAWSYTASHQLRHFYPESLDPGISGRARVLMAQRDDDVTVPEWMDLIADSDPNMLDDFETFEIDNEVSLPAILAEYRKAWSTTAD